MQRQLRLAFRHTLWTGYQNATRTRFLYFQMQIKHGENGRAVAAAVVLIKIQQLVSIRSSADCTMKDRKRSASARDSRAGQSDTDDAGMRVQFSNVTESTRCIGTNALTIFGLHNSLLWNYPWVEFGFWAAVTSPNPASAIYADINYTFVFTHNIRTKAFG